MTDDIVARLRGHIAITTRIHPAKDGFPKAVYVQGPSPICKEAADEIERLRAERNQLRAEIVDRVLRFRADVPWNTDSKARMKCEAYAAERGWFGLYDEINKLASKIEAADA